MSEERCFRGGRLNSSLQEFQENFCSSHADYWKEEGAPTCASETVKEMVKRNFLGSRSMRIFLQGKRLNWKYKSNPGIKDLPSRNIGRKRAKYNLFIFIVPSLLTLRYFRDIKLDGFKLSLCSFTATHSSCEWGISPLQQAGGVGRNPKTGRSQPCICQNFKFFLWYIVLSLLRLWVVTIVMAFIRQVPLYHRKRLEIT